MKLLKQIAYTILNISFRLLLIMLFSVIAFASLFSDPTYIKNTLVEQNVYDNGVNALIDTNSETMIFERSEITFGDQSVRDVLNTVFPAEDLQYISETIINKVYMWLEQDSETLDFSIDLRPNKDRLTTGFTNIAVNRLKSLPDCENRGQTSLDPFSADCVPKEIDIDVEREAIYEQISQAEGVLDNPVISDEILLADNNVRFDSKYAQLPIIYNQLQILPVYIIMVLTILAIVQVILFRSRKHGLQKLGYSIVSTSVSYVALTFVFGVILPQITGSLPLLQGSSTGIDGLISRVTVSISQDYTVHLLYATVPALLIGSCIYIWTKLSKDTVTYKQAMKKSGLVSSIYNDYKKSTTKKHGIQKRKPPIQSSDQPDKKTPKKKSSKYRTIPKKEL